MNIKTVVRMILVLIASSLGACASLHTPRPVKPMTIIVQRPMVSPVMVAPSVHLSNVVVDVPAVSLPPITPWQQIEQATRKFLASVRASGANYVRFTKGADLRREVHCLAENIYYEARGETLKGKLAIANATLNRVKSFMFPETVCAVVWQPYQFSWTLNRLHRIPHREIPYWRQAEMIARAALQGGRIDNLEDVTDGATNFHTIYIHPRWRKHGWLETVRIDHHIFYRKPILEAANK